MYCGAKTNRKSWPKVLVFTLKLARKHEIFSTRTTRATTSSLSQPILQLELIEEVAFSFNGGKDSTVLLHLLRAGYFLHQAEQSDSNGDLTDCDFTFPIQTIYFESSSAFPEINSFTYETASTYGVLLDIIRLDFKSGLEALLKANPIRAIFLGVCIGDPTAVGQEQFSPSSSGWPPFMRVNPILDWSYSYTSIGSMHDTVPNALLCIKNSDNSKEKFRAAYMLPDGRLERAGRAVCGRFPAVGNGLKSVDVNENGILTASGIAVGDELLFGTIEDQLGPSLCRKLRSIGWAVSQIVVIDSVADEVERQKSANDLAPDEEFEEYLRHL
ncbi:putative FAD synthase [Camellia lanceoleosa]|uniref:FAD synthase n=1 Tax=Camellia lanceoleosa TaxID=1840588 RepID=A0ACC0HR20_9ERIC|nr:putative FAD synthase [Camellia lanceoleosa]